jgi:hypothetical protein
MFKAATTNQARNSSLDARSMLTDNLQQTQSHTSTVGLTVKTSPAVQFTGKGVIGSFQDKLKKLTLPLISLYQDSIV